MGNTKEFLLGERRGTDSEYVSISPAKIVNGVKGRIVKRRGDNDNRTNLPKYAATSDVYFRKNHRGVCQARVYLDHKMCIDFDWSHQHVNRKDGRIFQIGTIHVQLWQLDEDGNFHRLSDQARFMNNKEMKKYGPILKTFCPTIKMR